MAKEAVYHDHLIPILERANSIVKKPPSVGHLTDLKRLAGAIHELHGTTPALQHIAKLAEEYVAARRPFTSGIVASRSSDQVLTELRATVKSNYGLRSTYEIQKEPDFKAQGKGLERTGKSAYGALAKANAGQRYEKLVAAQAETHTGVHAAGLDARAALDEHHRGRAAQHRQWAAQAGTPGQKKAHGQVAAFHEKAAVHQREAASHETSRGKDQAHRVIQGPHGGRYVVTATGAHWYIGRSG